MGSRTDFYPSFFHFPAYTVVKHATLRIRGEGISFPLPLWWLWGGAGEKGLKISLKLAVIKGKEGGREGGGSWKVPPSLPPPPLPLPPGPKGGHLLSLSSSSSFLPCLLVEGEEVGKRESFSAQKAAAAKKSLGLFFRRGEGIISSLLIITLVFHDSFYSSSRVESKSFPEACGGAGGGFCWVVGYY